MKTTLSSAQIADARRELEKLPLLGPAMWLFARDPQRRFTFVADLDWRLMPPLVLDQCRLYSREGLPWAFVTWARVSDAVDQRLRSSAPVIAPHEWRCGDKPWLIDVVAPFGDARAAAQQALKEVADMPSAMAWLPDSGGHAVPMEILRDG